MSENYSESELKAVKETLHDNGKRLFLESGVKAVSAEKIADDSGISIELFNRCYSSIETLFFAILEKEERLFRDTLEQLIAENKENPKIAFFNVLNTAMQLIAKNPLVKKVIDTGEIEYLMTKIPKEHLEKYFTGDKEYFTSMVDYFQTRGMSSDIPSPILANTLRTLFIIPFFKENIGEEEYETSILALAKVFTEGLFKE
ncbi:MAG: TetR family transcriptional regulator [Melioribacteraceae bacterium]|nr:MAG: TetR family transcriptional regulator [Melioribacteraceae bacterium]